MVFVSFQAGQPAEHGLRSEEVNVHMSSVCVCVESSLLKDSN